MGRAGRERVMEGFDIRRTIETVLEPLLETPGSSLHPFRRPARVSSSKRRLRRAVGRLSRIAAGPGSGARILMYHRVNASHPGDRLTVAPDLFARQMEALKASGRPVLPLEELVAGLRGERPLPAGAVAITFDDGFRDNHAEALPILERSGLTATFFVSTGYMGTGRGFSRYQGCCDADEAMTWTEVAELLARGHAVGGHGRSHRELKGLGPEELSDEVLGSYQDIAQALGRAPAFFCYPRGSEDGAVRQAAREAGYLAALSVYPGTNRPDTDLFALRRTEIAGNDDLRDFLFKLEGGFDGWHRLRQGLSRARA